MTIDEFNVKIKLETKDFDSKVNQVYQKYKKLQDESKKAGKVAKDSAKEAAEGQAEFNEEIEETAEKTEKATKKQNEFWKKVKDMAVGSFIFNKISQAIQKMSDAYKDGIKNVYAFSKANGLAFSTIMDSWSSKVYAVKNAIGAMMATFITGLEPYLEKILDFLIELFNQLSIFFSRLFKIDAIIANKDVLKQWADNNKETQKTLGILAGFDTINIWGDSSNLSKDTLPEDAFTVKPYDGEDAWKGLKDIVNNWWEEFKKWWTGYEIRDPEDNHLIDFEVGAWGKIKEWVKDIWEKFKLWSFGDEETGSLGIWQKNIVPFLSNLWENLKEHLVKLAEYIIDSLNNRVVKKFTEYTANATARKVTGQETTVVEDSIFAGIGRFFKKATELINGSIRLSSFSPIRLNATGGVYTRPTLGMVGEYSGASSNPELITPTSLLDDRLQANNNTLINAWAQMTSQIIGAINNVDMTVSIGDTVIAQSAARGNQNFIRQTGRGLF